MHKRDWFTYFFPFLFSPLIGFVILCLLEVRYRFRVQIFANTLLSVQRRSGGGTPSQNLGSPQICPRQIFAYWYSGSAFIPRFSPVLRIFRVLSMIFMTSSVWYQRFTVMLLSSILPNGFSHGRELEYPLYRSWMRKIWIKRKRYYMYYV